VTPGGSYNPLRTTPVGYHIRKVWAIPVSLAATQGISVDFFSSGYLDVSVPPLTSSCPMCSGTGTGALPPVGFPIRTSPDQSPLDGSPELIAAYHVLHRLLTPRHPPYAISSLTKRIPLRNTVQFSRYDLHRNHLGAELNAQDGILHLLYPLKQDLFLENSGFFGISAFPSGVLLSEQVLLGLVDIEDTADSNAEAEDEGQYPSHPADRPFKSISPNTFRRL
jgi:hypothetical protein